MSSSNILSAGIILLRETPQGCRYLLLRAYNYWDFPKGEVETDESPFRAAKREVREETGLEQLSFPWQQAYYQTDVYGNNKVARYYLAKTDQAMVTPGISPELGRPEHHEYRWASYHQAEQLLNARVKKALAWARDVSGC